MPHLLSWDEREGKARAHRTTIGSVGNFGHFGIARVGVRMPTIQAFGLEYATNYHLAEWAFGPQTQKLPTNPKSAQEGFGLGRVF